VCLSEATVVKEADPLPASFWSRQIQCQPGRVSAPCGLSARGNQNRSHSSNALAYANLVLALS